MNKKILTILILCMFIVPLASAIETRCIAPHGGDVTYGSDVYQEMHNSSFELFPFYYEYLVI